MNFQSILSELANERGLSLMPLTNMSKYACSCKIPCCGGHVVRIESESASDAIICIQDASGLCLCVIHGEITSRYPDVLSTGAVLLFSDITLLVTRGKMPPLLIACLENLVGLMLPELPEPLVGPVQEPEPSANLDTCSAVFQDEAYEIQSGIVHPSFGGEGDVNCDYPAMTSGSEESKRAENKGNVNRDSPRHLRQPISSNAGWSTIAVDDDENCLELVDDL